MSIQRVAVAVRSAAQCQRSPRPTGRFIVTSRYLSTSFIARQDQPAATRSNPSPTTFTPRSSAVPSTPADSKSQERSLTAGLLDPLPDADDQSERVDWTRSFHGLSNEAFAPEVGTTLMQSLDVDDIEIKPDGIIYLPEIKYRRILNKAFGPGGWGLAPRGETIVTGKLVTREYGLVCGGRYLF